MKKLLMLFSFQMISCIHVFGVNEIISGNSMQIITIILLIIAITVIIIFQIRKKDTSGFEIVNNELDRQKEISNQLTGKNQELITQINKYEAQIKERDAKVGELQIEVNSLKLAREKDNENVSERIKELENARLNLEAERRRVVSEEELKRKEMDENRNRIWNQHEEKSISIMRDICRKKDISLQSFDNKNLPDTFDKSFKPDFLVKVLNQYVIFDPKSSASKSINTYLQTQVKSTAKKIKESSSYEDIYNTVYLLVPSIDLEEIKETYYFEQGISFLIIPIEAFEPIVRVLRRLEDYDLADKYDPQERENIINFIALLNHYIREQNANNILSTIKGLHVLAESENIPNDVLGEINNKINSIRISQPSKVQLKKLLDNPELQFEEVKKLIHPQVPKISKDEILDANED